MLLHLNITPTVLEAMLQFYTVQFLWILDMSAYRKAFHKPSVFMD